VADIVTRSHLTRLLSALAAVAALVVAALVVAGGDDGARTRAVAEHPVAIPAALRTVTVHGTMPPPSAHERRLSALLEHGAMPVGAMTAEVLTDTDCAPDERMISHCRNVVRLQDGHELVLRHPHDMSRVPCLAPGERIRLVPAV
jgi:hypothetical protein